MKVAYWITFDERTLLAEGAPFMEAQMVALIEGLEHSAAQQGLTIPGSCDVVLEHDTAEAHEARQAAIDGYAADEGIPSWPAPRLAVLRAEADGEPTGGTPT